MFLLIISLPFMLLPLPFMLLPLPLAIYTFLRVNSRGYALTSKRVIAKQGIISLNTEEMRIDRIENIRISRGIMESILGGGSLVVTGIGGSKVVLKCICAPELAKKMIEVLTEDS
ncbi:MAG: PH domain-containing protein [Candidatus Hydrogenedentes bacterium]|nr:PH domain-containing protein [Candidatus Hydrogenedentota bacterium]